MAKGETDTLYLQTATMSQLGALVSPSGFELRGHLALCLKRHFLPVAVALVGAKERLSGISRRER